MSWQYDWGNFIELDIDSDKVDEALSDFPTLVVLSSGTGMNDFDATGVFTSMADDVAVDSYTKFMLPWIGDESDSRHTVHMAYNPTLTVLSGIPCLYLEEGGGTPDYFVVPDSSDWDFGTGDFTIEMWVSMTATGLTIINRPFSHSNVLTTDGAWAVGLGTDASWRSGISFNFSGRSASTTTTSYSDELNISSGEWYHIAISRDSNTLRFYLDGNLIGMDTRTDNLTSGGDWFMRCGAVEHTATETFDGSMARIRISKDISRYNSGSYHTLSGTSMSVNNATTGTAANLVDGSTTGGSFWENTAGYPNWCKYDFGTSSGIVNGYTVSAGDSEQARMPMTWQFQGSDDDSIWDVLDSRSSETSWSSQETRYYSLTNATPYRYYRLYMTAGNHATWIRMFEWELVEYTPFTPPTSYTNDSYTKFLYMCQGEQSASSHNIIMGDSNVRFEGSSPLFDDTNYWNFDGTNYITAPDHSDWDFGSQDWTIEYWFKIDTLGNWREQITKRSNSGHYRWIVTAVDSTGRLTAAVADTASSWGFGSSAIDTGIKAGQWYHFAFTRENNTMRVFLDGLVVNSGVMTGSVYNDTSPLVIGAGASDGTYGHIGDIFGLRISKGIARYTSRFVPANLPHGDSYHNRKKIAFADANSNRLYAEIDRWDHAYRRAWLWVKVPSISSSTDTKFYMYYDKTKSDNSVWVGDTGELPATQVWNNAYGVVFHNKMKDFVSPSPFIDSTSNYNDGATNSLLPGDIIEGKVAECFRYTGAGDYCTAPWNSTYATDNFTLEVVMNVYGGSGANRTIVAKDSGTTNPGYHMRRNATTGIGFFEIDGPSHNASVTGPAFNYNQWYYLASRLNTTTSGIDVFYYDAIVASGTSSPLTVSQTTNLMYIGRNAGGGDWAWPIDEIRVSHTARSDAWIKATYYTMWDDFITYSQGTPAVYTASGTVTVDNTLTDNIPVRLYRRATGELTDSATTISGGLWALDSPYNEDHYAVALYTTSGTNALIYDWVAP